MKPSEILQEYIPINPISQEEIDVIPKNDEWSRKWKIVQRVRQLSSDRYRYYTHSAPAKILNRYLDDDCVIFYIKDLFGAMFMIKSKMKYFCFFCKNANLDLGGMGYSIMDVPVKDVLKVVEKLPDKYRKDEDHFKILDENELQRCKNMLLVDNLKD